MGQDFVARKAAKKQRKRSARDAETGRKQKRKRKEDGFEVAGGVLLCLGCAVTPSGAQPLSSITLAAWVSSSGSHAVPMKHLLVIVGP